MDGEERKRKLEAAKAKLASFKKKQRNRSKKSKHHHATQPDSQSVTDDALNSAKAGDSIAVQTGSYHSDRAMTLSEDSDVSTTADEISTEEEASYSAGLSPREKIQELELTISDQQMALQQLTIENKNLRDREAELAETIIARDSVIGELKDNVSRSASHVKNLHENLTSATESIMSADGDQSEIVEQLVNARQELKVCLQSLKNQESTMQEMASKLAEKSIEAEEAHEQCRSLKAELDKTMQSQTLSSDETQSALTRLRSELEKQHAQQIALMERELDNARLEIKALNEYEEKRRLEEEEAESVMDDVKAYQEQVQQLTLQLETSFRNAEKERKEHDKEVVKLNQNLIRTIDKYESQLQTEKDLAADLEGRLEMSDTVSSEIQASFSKQLQQLQEERENLRSQLREAEGAAIENAASTKIIENLEDQVATYKAEVEETEKLVDERNEEIRKSQSELEKLKKKIGTLGEVNDELSAKLKSSQEEIEKGRKEASDKDTKFEEAQIKFEVEKEKLKDAHKEQMETILHDAAQKAKEDVANTRALVEEEMEEKLKQAREEHTDELKNLHSQHHRKVEEMKTEMEAKMKDIKDSLEQEKKDQVGAVKEVHERSREREFNQLVQTHEEELMRSRQQHEEILEALQNEHEKAINKLKERHKENKILDDNRLVRELEKEWESKMENLKQELDREREREMEHVKISMKEKHDNELQKILEESSSTAKELHHETARMEEEFDKKMKDCIANYESKIEELNAQHETLKEADEKRQFEKLEKLEDDHKKKVEEMEAKMKRLLQEQRDEQESAIQLIKDEAAAREETEKQIGQQMASLQHQLKEASTKLEEQYEQKMSNLETEHQQENETLKEELKQLQDNLKNIQAERDDIIHQAEESRKRLESLHHDEMAALRQELDSHVQDHKDRLQKVQEDMETAQVAQTQLQEVQEELEGWMEQVDLMKNDFSDKEKEMLEKHKKAMDQIAKEHEEKSAELREQLEAHVKSKEEMEMARCDLESKLEDYKLKLTAAQANLASLSASSPLRPVSSASDYDPANLAAMKSDIRNALTITHISDVSGIGEDIEEGALQLTADEELIEEQLEEGDLPTMEEGELVESKEDEVELSPPSKDRSSSSSSSEEDERHGDESSDIEKSEDAKHLTIKDLENRIELLEDELQKLAKSHDDEIHNLVKKYEEQIVGKEESMENEHKLAVAKLLEEHATEKEELAKKHEEVLQSLEEEKQTELMQLRLKCASETASQVEEEIAALRLQLEKSHSDDIESIKLDMESKHSEKLEKLLEEKQHEKEMEMQNLTDEHATSLEKKISTLMAELYEQKQESLRQRDEAHEIKILAIEEERRKAASAKESEWMEINNKLQEEVIQLKLNVDNARMEQKTLIESLESGENDILSSIYEKHRNEIEKLNEEYENKIKLQSDEYEKAQAEYIEQHQERLDKFLEEREQDIRDVEEKKQKEIIESQEKYETQIKELKSEFENWKTAQLREIEENFQGEKSKLIEEHRDEVRAVAIKLVEVRDERDQLLSDKDGLLSQIQRLDTEQDESQAELKAALTSHHMDKFQAAITELDQHHTEEMEKLRQDHEKETEQYKQVSEDLIKKMKNLEKDYETGIRSAREEKESELAAMQDLFDEKFSEQQMDHGSALTSMREAHEAQMQALQEEHDTQLQLIEQEIENQNKSHRAALDEILQSQADKLKELQKQFEIALTATKHEEQHKSEKLQQHIVELEKQIESSKRNDSDSSSDSDSDDGKKDSEEIAKLKELLESAEEDRQDMTSKIEFERAEYQGEIDQLQEEIASKDENIKELESELEKNKDALGSLKERFDTVSSRREREGREEDNLLHILQDDLERLNDERDQLSAANRQLLSTLTELVQSNHKCEDLISKKLQKCATDRTGKDSVLTEGEKSEDSSNKSDIGAGAGAETHGTTSPGKLGASGISFEDEGLDLSQRLAESMFAGPDLDGSARDVAVESGTRLQQAVQQLVDVVQMDDQLNLIQQPQIIIGGDGDGSERVGKKQCDDEDDDTSSRSSESENAGKVEELMAEYVTQQIELQKRIEEQEQESINLQSQIENYQSQNKNLQEENSMLQKQVVALTAGGDEAQENLLKLNSKLSAEKQALSDQFEASRIHSEKQILQLDAALDAEAKKKEERENEHAVFVDDLQTQIDALHKQITSNSKFSAEQTNERELEREQFQEEINHLQDELDKRHLMRSDSNLAQEAGDSSSSSSANPDRDESQKLTEESKNLDGGHCFTPVQSSTPVGVYKLQAKGSSGQIGLGACSMLHSVSRLEEELETRDADYQKQIAKMKQEEEKLKKTIEEYEENIQELRARGSEQSELDLVREQLQDMTREREVIQQELYDNLLKVSALEAKLDQYKHGNEGSSTDPNNPTLVEQLQMKLEQEREENEVKMMQLMEAQNQLRNAIIEKEDHIEELLREIETFRNLQVENAKLKEHLISKEASPPSTSRVEEMEALSQQLLEEKNAEIDELQNRIQVLESKQDSSSESSEDDEETIQKSKEEILRLQSQIKDMKERFSLHEDGVDVNEKFESLRQENDSLRAEISQIKDMDSSQENRFPVLGIPADIQEKISDLENLLGRDEQSSDQATDSSNSHNEVLEDKLLELENELKSKPHTILGRILLAKDNEISAKNQEIENVGDALSKQNENVASLTEKVAGLQHDLNEPDVKIRLRLKGENSKKDQHKEVDVEKESVSSDTDERSSSSSSNIEDESQSQDEEAFGTSVDEIVPITVTQQEETPSQDQKEREIFINEQLRVLSEKREECEVLSNKVAEMEARFEELQTELDARSKELELAQSNQPDVEALSEKEVLDIPSVQSAIQKATALLEEKLYATQNEVSSAKSEKEKLVATLEDVQKEYLSLLQETQKYQEMEDSQTLLRDRIQELEGFLSQRQEELQQAQQDSDHLQDQVEWLESKLQELKEEKEEEDETDGQVSKTEESLAEKEVDIEKLLDELKKKEEEVEDFETQVKDSVQQSKLLESKVELLQNERDILNTQKDQLQQESEQLKSKVDTLENAAVELEAKVKELEALKTEHLIESKATMDRDEKLKESDATSTSSESGQDEEVGAVSQEDLIRQHESKMEDMKQKYSHALTRVVEDTKRQMLDEHEKSIKALQEKHRRDITEILQESMAGGDSELARRLREELDIADQLDQNLMGHYASGTTPRDGDSDDDIPRKLQALLERVHNEGVQVLSLSELMFLKQHQKPLRTTSTTTVPPATVEEAQQTSMRLEEDMAKLRDTYDGEKLALVDALQSLKNLVIQANPELSEEGMPDRDDHRANLINAVADVFEKEREVLIAELQTSVVEAEIEARNAEGTDETNTRTIKPAGEKLEALERKIKEQGQQHTAAIEQLVALDREPLLAEITELKEDREMLKETEEKLQHLEAQMSSNKATRYQNIFLLQSQVERLEYKLQQEKALAADVRAALESERIRTEDYIPALQREQDRSVELDTELGKMQKKLADDAKITQTRTEALQSELDEGKKQLQDVKSEMFEARQKMRDAKEDLEQMDHDLAKANSDNDRTVKDLKHALATEENRREQLEKSLDMERNNVAQLHEELAKLRADTREEIEVQKIRLGEQEGKYTKERQKRKELAAELEQQEKSNENLRHTLEEERQMAQTARQRDRDTVAELQRILDDARNETDIVQRKMDSAREDALMAKRHLEEIQLSHQESLDAEKSIRDRLESALEDAREEKEDLQSRIQTLGDDLRRQKISNLVSNTVPASHHTPESLNMNRRQLESMRQRLQMESTKIQELLSKNAQRIPLATSEGLGEHREEAKEIASEMEQVDSVKRSLAEMQQELREMYSSLSVPRRDRPNSIEESDFSDQVMKQNAELVELNTRHTDEKMTLRDQLRKLEEEVWKANAGAEIAAGGATDNRIQPRQVQEMANRIHRLYMRYLRAESFRKALVYQKKYLLLLVGGFQDCEEATLAVVARMGAYPGADADNFYTHRSAAFKKFRSAARVVMAISRFRFLVKKSHRASESVSASIRERHGASPLANGYHSTHSRKPYTHPESPNHRPHSSASGHGYPDKSPSPTPLPHHRATSYERPWGGSDVRTRPLRGGPLYSDTPPTKLSPRVPYDPSPSDVRPRNAYTRSSTVPYLHSYGDQPSATAMSYLNGYDNPSGSRPRSYHMDYRSPDTSALTHSRSQPVESDPSLNEYIQKLENLQHRLEQNPHRYQR